MGSAAAQVLVGEVEVGLPVEGLDVVVAGSDVIADAAHGGLVDGGHL